MRTALLIALVPLMPLLAAAITAFLKRERREASAALAIGAQLAALAVSFILFVNTVIASRGEHGIARLVHNFVWLTFGNEPLRLGLLLDPLSAGMALTVTLVSLLVFIFSVASMDEDRNFTRFFCFLSFFSAAMLGVVLSNSLLLTFICWELAGLASYLLIGFWFHKPEAAAAAKKAFLTTRVGDIGFFLGMLWLSKSAGTVLFYDNGAGCLEQAALSHLLAPVGGVFGGLAVCNAIAFLIFAGAAGKSAQFPVHVWLPDAMEGPTPVSALVHGATMVAAGVFLVARVFPIFSAASPSGVSLALTVVAWVGAFTALFAALLAVAQTDIKRILAYSTVSQLGFIMLTLGAGNVGAAMLYLVAHAFFQALLFLGAGSVIHGVQEERDIRKMGGLRRYMPVTFAAYSIGVMVLCSLPFFFSGCWSKDAGLHVAHGWPASRLPLDMALVAAFLTVFCMTRQMIYVFFGDYRGHLRPHESPGMMTLPLTVLAGAAILIFIPATPAWPWFESFVVGEHPVFNAGKFFGGGFPLIAGILLAIAFQVIGLGCLLYGRLKVAESADGVHAVLDPLQRKFPTFYKALGCRLYIDEFYNATLARGLAACGLIAAWVDRWVFQGGVGIATWFSVFISRVCNGVDRNLINFGFDTSCEGIIGAGEEIAARQTGRVQRYLCILGIGMVVLLAVIGWLLA